MKKVSGRLANLTPEQREKLLKKLREQKKEQGHISVKENIELKHFRVQLDQQVLSFSQQRLWFLDQLGGLQSAYNIPAKLKLSGRLNVLALEKAFQFVVERHDLLRSSIVVEQSGPCLKINETQVFKLKSTDLSSLNKTEISGQLEAITKSEACEPFSLEKGPLFRARLLLLTNNESVLLICMHHIISDAWSMRILVKEISLAYNKYANNKLLQLPQNELRYVDYAAWQRQSLAKGFYQQQASFWKETLSGLDVLNFPFDKPRPAEQNHVGRQLVFELSESLSNKLRTLARTENKTLFSLLLAAWYVFLYRYSSQEDICVGTPVANRPHSELENLIGFFVNTLPIRANINPSKKFSEFLEQIQKNALAAFANPDIPFEKIIDDLGLDRDLSQSPVFQTMFSFQNDAVEEGLDFENLAISFTPIHTNTAKFDLSLDVVDQKKNLKLSLEYNSDILLEQSAQGIKDNLVTLLESISLDPSLKIYELNCIHENGIKYQLQSWHNTEKFYKHEKNISQQFEEQVNQCPDSIAFIYQNIELTYVQLNARANKLANRLLKKGIKSGSHVALLFRKDDSFIISLLALIKTGASYVTIDENSSNDFLAYCFSENNISLLLTKKNLLNNLDLRPYELNHFCVDNDLSWQEESDANLNLSINSEHLLYELVVSNYQSIDETKLGNTKKIDTHFKKVFSNHRNISNLVNWYVSQHDVHEQGCRYLLNDSLSLEKSQKTLLAPLLSGHVLVFPSATELSPKELVECIKDKKINSFDCTPSYFYRLLHVKDAIKNLASLKFLFLSGESIQAKQLFTWQLASDCRIINYYSIHDNAEIVSAFVIDSQDDFFVESIPIGKPINNTNLYLLDTYSQLVPVGVYAQLYISSDTLTKHDRAEQQIFIENPISGKSGKLYESGDMARYLANGNIELLGPIQKIIKVQGYYIDKIRVLNALLSFPNIIEASLLKADDALVAFIVFGKNKSTGSEHFEVEVLSKHLKSSLPDYMLPRAYHIVEALPLNLSKKLDEARLYHYLESFNKQRSYWQTQTAELPYLQLPQQAYENSQSIRELSEVCFSFNAEQSIELKCLSQQVGDNLRTSLMAVYQILLSRYSGQLDFPIGIVERSHFQFNELMTKPHNYLLIRSDVKAGMNFATLQNVVNSTLAEALENKDFPFSEILKLLNKDKSAEGNNSLFKSILHFKEQETESIKNTIKDIHSDLVLEFFEAEGKIKGTFFYNTSVFEEQFIIQIGEHLKNLVASLLHEKNVNIEQLNYLSSEERKNILALSRGQDLDYESYQNIPDFLAALSSEFQQYPALLFQVADQEESLSYQVLHQRSESLALYLQSLGLRPQAPVALCLERGVDMVIALLAVLKAGSPYLPLDPELPKERLSFMLEDSAAQFVLCQRDTARRFEGFEAKSFDRLIDLQNSEVLAAQSTCQGTLKNPATLDDLFNIIYTSGSTGLPKGVMVTQRGILNRIQWMQAEYQLKPSDRVLQKTTYSFDVSVWEFIWPLSVGAGLVLAKPAGHKDPLYLNNCIKQFSVSHCHFVPSMLWSWLELSAEQLKYNPQALDSLHKVFCSGEALSREAVNRFYQLLPDCELHNLYGPTEAAIDVSYWHCEKNLADQHMLPIGRPVSNTQLYVLDKHLNLVASGIAGELYIGGVQLARAYLNRDELNKITFIENKIDGLGLQRLYKTGDLVRQHKDGVIEYLGRIDQQVKIRGYRIELGEIEARLQGMEELALSVVVAVDLNGSQKLAAYVSKVKHLDISDEALKQEIKQYLAQHLPVYMVPSIIVVLDAMPLLENGKINRKQLPALETSTLQSAEYIAAESELEATLQEIWQSVLGLKNVSTRDNFFDLGGDSILSIQIISAARRKNIILSPSQIFRHPSIAELAQIASLDQQSIQAEQGAIKGKFIGSPIQQWFFTTFYEKNKKEAQHFNQSVLLNLKTPIDLSLLKVIAKRLIEQHDVLNSFFNYENGAWYQVHDENYLIDEKLECVLSEGSVSGNTHKQKEDSLYQNLLHAQKSLNIEQGQVFHLRLINELKSGFAYQSLYMTAHHLVVDGVSWRILMEDIDSLLEIASDSHNALIGNFSERCQMALLDKTWSFKQWTQGLASLYSAQLIEADKNYWLNKVEKFHYYQSPLNKKEIVEYKPLFKNQKRIGFTSSKSISDKFLKQANRSFKSEANDILLCALFDTFINTPTSVINPTTRFDKLLLSLETHGRDVSDKIFEHLSMPDVSRTLGWFTNLFPLLLSREVDKTSLTWGDKLKNIKEQIRQVPNKGMGFGLLKQQAELQTDKVLQELLNLAETLKPELSFNYLGQFGSEDSYQNFVVNTDVRKLNNADFLDQSALLERAHSLDIVIFVNDGCLQCDFLYDQMLYEHDQMHQYLAIYQQRLEALIQYCCEQNYSSLSPSDLKSLSLTQKEIEIIEDLYQKNQTSDQHSALGFYDIESMHGLLPTQAGMLFHSLYQGASSQESTYFEQFCIQLKGPLEIPILEMAWQAVIQSYPSLRSCFHWQFSEFVQIVFKDIPFHIEHHALAVNNSSAFDLATFLSNDKRCGFDLSKAPLMRVSVVDISANQQWLVWSYHHILLDGWSVPLVLNSLFENYVSLIEGKNLSKQTNSVYSYENYVEWYKSHQGQDNAFWNRELEGFVEPNAIELEPVAFPINTEPSQASIQNETSADESVEKNLDFELSQSLRDFARRHHLTLNTLVQSAWAILLSYYSGDDDVIFGATVSGRSEQYPGAENIVGMFINTLPLRIRLNENMNLLALLKLVQNTQQNIVTHQSNSLMEIQKKLGLESEVALFNSILVFENFPVSEKLKQENPWFTVEGFHSYEKTNYPITISVEPNDTINFRVLFDNQLYRKETMVRLLGHLACLLEAFPRSEAKNIFDIPYISELERKALDHWNNTETDYPRESSLVELVEQSVRQNPQQIALKFDDLVLSYEQLNKLANQFSHYLQEQGAGKGKRIVLFMDRSEELLISALAVIKTGAAYVPLDPSYPEERLKYMLQDCEPSIILSVLNNKLSLEKALGSAQENLSNRKIIYVDESKANFKNFSDQNPILSEALKADDLAYLMYTSGSTGQPKGVCLSHRSIIRLVMNTWYLPLGPKDKVGHICNVCFDASAYEIWGALLNGASLIGFDRETILSEDLFAEKLQKEAVTNMLMTTSLFHLYSRHRPEIFNQLRCLLIGGEPLLPDAARRVLENSRPLHLMNVYGPTENGVLTTVFDTWNLAEGAKNTPVGKPISNTTVYIVNKRNQELPVGVVGELVSGGDGVGLGYWKLDTITARTFVSDPFSKNTNARMYRTGDLARRLPDGSFEVLGRMDDQLKIRGFRVEPGEIIERLNAMSAVKDAVVVIVESEGHKKHLVAYLVVKEEEKDKLDLLQAKKLLIESLPSHMVPSFLIKIDSIPITPNGKLDKAKLPKPKFDEVLRDNYVAPRNTVEHELANIWSDVLKISAIGIFDNFFELGGDSIISIQIVSRAKRAGLNISPKLLFEHPTIAELAQQVSSKNNAVVAEQGLVSGEVKLTPIQQWFFEQNINEPNHFNQSLLFNVEGFLTVQSITPLVSALLKQHDVLRLRFTLIKGEWVQKHDNSARSLSSLADILSEQNFSHTQDPYQHLLDHAALVQTQINLSKGPLIKMVLYHLGAQGQKLLVIAHHLIMDGVSWRILLDHLNIGMKQQANNQAIDFGEKTSSYQFWARTLQEYAQSEYVLQQQTYWENLFNKVSTANILDVRKLREQQNNFLQKRITFNLSQEKSAALLRDCHQAFRTDVQDLLLLAFTMALKESALGESAWISLESHGRDTLKLAFADQVDNSSTLGWFTSIYPVLLTFEEQSWQDRNIAALIKQTKNNLREIPDQGLGFSLLKYINKEDQFRNLLEETPDSEISFNYLGQVSDAHNLSQLSLDPNYIGHDNSEKNKSTFALNLSAIFHKEKFSFTFAYDAQLFEEQKIEKLSDIFSKNLSEIVDYCLQDSNFGFTPSDLPYFPIAQAELDRICHEQVLEKQTRLQAIYPLSPMQEGMLFHSRLDKNSGMYCEQISVLFAGHMRVAAMQQAWNDAIACHDILRTSFIWESLTKPLQLVRSKVRIDIQVLDWRLETDIDKRLQQFLKEDRLQGFDFSNAPLMRLHYIHWPKSAADTSAGLSLGRFIWTYHHILLDGWSMPLLLREVFDRYNFLSEAEQGKSSTALTSYYKQEARYEDYIEWLYTRSNNTNVMHAANNYVENNSVVNSSVEKSASELFWLAYLEGFEEPNSLAITKRNNKHNNNHLTPELLDSGLQYQELSNGLNEQQTKNLQILAARHQVTLNTILQGAWALLLNRYSGEQDIVFGITVSGRPSGLNHIESIIGLFINTVPFRVQVNPKTKLDQWLKSILKNQVQLRQFETTPLVDIQAQSHIEGSRALFDSILVFENYPLDETLENAPLGLKLVDLQVYEQTNFPLSLIILPGQTLDIRMLFDTETFEHETIRQVLRHLKTILLALCDVEDSEVKELKDIVYLSEQEQQIINQATNNSEREYPRNDYLQDIVARQDANKLALVSERGQLSFGELECKAKQLAVYIQSDALGESRVRAGDKVIVCLNRSTDLIVAILAILKAGASYVPLDPGYPEERQRYMLEDTQTRLIISDAENASLVKHLSSTKSFRNSINFIDINAKASLIATMDVNTLAQLPNYIENEDIPAAILYTSGSTGQPKGVCLSHRGLSRMVLNTNYMRIHESDRVAHVSNICFDAASFEIWAALLNGLPLVILDRDIMLDLEKFEQQLKQQKVSILLITTALFNLVAKERVSAFETINYLFFGGEACNAGMVKRVFELASPKHLMHMYGPSENSTYATWYEVKNIEEDVKTIPIGKSVSNSQVYIMNQQGNLLPVDVAGEIVCAGDGLALGYLNKPEQTQKAFVMRALPNKAPERMYLTGDLGVYRADGNIEILGRIDNQVKIRGHRIEPEEVTARINALPDIKKAYVLVKQDKEDKKFLVAYFVPETFWLNTQEDKLSRARELKIKLKAQMPDYMVPSFYVEIDELPLTPNGKIDTKALPEAEALQSHSDYQAPENVLEEALVQIWQDVLQHKKIGVYDDFFELGGHSLLVTQVHSRIRQQLNIDVPLRTLFELPSIREFSEFWQAIEASQNTFDASNDINNDQEFEEGEL